MKPIDADGLWWPDNDETRASAGTLSFEPGAGAKLRLIGGWLDELHVRVSGDPAGLDDHQLRELGTFVAAAARAEAADTGSLGSTENTGRAGAYPDFPITFAVAHGVIDGAEITLLGLVETERSDGSIPGITSQAFTVSGGHIEPGTTVSGGSFRVSTLDSWCQNAVVHDDADEEMKPRSPLGEVIPGLAADDWKLGHVEGTNAIQKAIWPGPQGPDQGLSGGRYWSRTSGSAV